MYALTIKMKVNSTEDARSHLNNFEDILMTFDLEDIIGENSSSINVPGDAEMVVKKEVDNG